MRNATRFALLLLLISPAAAAVSAVGCGSSQTTGSSSTGTGAGNTGGGSSTTTGTGGSDAGTGGTDGGMCSQLGHACMSAGECCSGVCTNGVCNLGQCTSDNEACAASSDCCSGNCTAGKCVPLNPLCKTLGNSCAANAECCSGLCNGGKCSASSFCGQQGDFCAKATDCCGGICNLADAGATVGTCGPAPTGSANCKLTDGMLCGDPDGGTVTLGDAGIPGCGGGCCSRLCAPYGPTGVLICQPASGCHVVGDLCTKDGDCCGSAGLPGGSGTPVTCDITPPAVVGVCRNPMGCKPDGDVCKLDTMSCNATCNCCSGNCEQEDTCKLDNVGVPRCTGAQCVMPGGACATSANCCNNVPCVPNPADGGMPPFICYQGSCVPKCGECTINADCCPGTQCITTPGSTKGTCGPCEPPPDGGVPDSGVPDSGVPDSGVPDSGPTCSVYGQQCSSDGDCCNGVPCNSANAACQPGQTGCTCHFILK